MFDYDSTQGYDPEPEVCEHCGEVCDEDGKCPNPHTLWAGHVVDEGDICMHNLGSTNYLAYRSSTGWMLLGEKGKINLNQACEMIVNLWQDGPWKDDMEETE